MVLVQDEDAILDSLIARPLKPQKQFTVQRWVTFPCDRQGMVTTRVHKSEQGSYIYTLVPVLVTTRAFGGGDAVRRAREEIEGTKDGPGFMDRVWMKAFKTQSLSPHNPGRAAFVPVELHASVKGLELNLDE